MKKLILNIGLIIAAAFASWNTSAQCPTITGPANITVNNDAGICGAVVNYATPVGTDACASASGNILFVCDGDNTTATEIPAELTAAGYTVTTVYNDYVAGNNTILQGAGLAAYDVIYWHASGASGYGDIHNAATFTNLSTYVTNGGAVFVTGYDVIASPTDPELITFMGGTASIDGGVSGTETLTGSNSLTTGVTNIVGLVLNATGDHDGLMNLQPGTVGVATSGTYHGWTIRTLGAGEIAWVSTANLLGSTWPQWNTAGSGYKEALRNFAFNHSCQSTGNVLFVCDGNNTTATEIPAELTAAGYTVTTVYNDYVGGNNATLQGAIGAYEAIFWHASGASGYGEAHNAATFVNLTNYVNNGGAVFVTGYDVIASPDDPELITFMGGTSATDGGSQGNETLVGSNSLTTGETNIVGLVLNAPGDHDGLNGLQAGTIGVATNGTSHGWAIRTLGAGEIAWVSTANYTGMPWSYWNTAGTGYKEALRNFAYNHASCINVGPPVTTMTAGLASGAIFPVGTTTVTYQVVDGNGNNPQQVSFTVTVSDVEAPVAAIATLADVTNECSVTSLTAPTATDNCAATVLVTNNATLPITTQGTTTVTWTYDDGNGNTSMQVQNVVITDLTAPVADIATLADVTNECSVTSLTAPTATDNCASTVLVTNNATLPITAQGTTVVTWTYDDGNGNTSTQVQNVIVSDLTAPVADVATLSNVIDECSVTSLTAPTATDNCASTVIVTNDATLPITAQGTTAVTWTYDDGNGNTSTQVQNVVIADFSAPVVDMATLVDMTGTCDVTPTVPTATDNCIGAISGTPDVTFPITTQGTTVVTWTYDDGNGNTTTQTQNVIVTGVNVGVTQSGSLLTANASGVTYQWLDCDDSYAIISGETNVSFTPSAIVGSYAVEINNNGCLDTSACYLIDFTGLSEMKIIGISIYPNPSLGQFTINSDKASMESIQIMDARGRLIYDASNLNETSVKVNISNENPGVYYLRISGEFGTTIEKVVLQ